jgi:4,5-dihydroxyphthalate decarboxylase
MLEAGEIDALIAADSPKCVLEKRPNVGRLFEDYEAIERGYYRRTAIFPIMHLVAIKKDLAQDAKLVRSVYQSFLDAKNAMAQQLVQGMTFNNMTVMIPWLSNLIARNRELLGEDWWPYGISKNRQSLDAYLRYYYEQGLSKRRFTIEDIFVSSMLDT